MRADMRRGERELSLTRMLDRMTTRKTRRERGSDLQSTVDEMSAMNMHKGRKRRRPTRRCLQESVRAYHLCVKISVIVRRRSFRAAEYDTVVAKLLRTASTGLSGARLFSNDALGRELIVLDRFWFSLSDSDPDWDEIGPAAGRSETAAGAGDERSANAARKDTFRFLAPLSCCCWMPVSVVETEAVDGRENVTPFVREELFDSLRESGKGAGPRSGETDTVAVVMAVVGFDGLIAGVKGVGSGRMVMLELAEILRLLNLSATVGFC